MKGTYYFIPLLVTVFMSSCSNGNDNSEKQPQIDSIAIYEKIRLDKEVEKAFQDKDSKIERYVYIDKSHCLHVDRNCVALLQESTIIISTSNDEAELSHESPKYALHRISKKDVRSSHVAYCCSYCVDDDTYDELFKITQKSEPLRPAQE